MNECLQPFTNFQSTQFFCMTRAHPGKSSQNAEMRSGRTNQATKTSGMQEIDGTGRPCLITQITQIQRCKNVYTMSSSHFLKCSKSCCTDRVVVVFTRQTLQCIYPLSFYFKSPKLNLILLYIL